MARENKQIQQLLREARSGNRASLGNLAVIVRERMYPFVFRTTLNHDLTEDILQETLLAVVQQISTLRGDRKFWPWVYRIAWNKVQDNFRRHRVRSLARAFFLKNQHHTKRTQADNRNLLEARIHEETLQQVSSILEQLSRRHRDILRLRYYDRLPYNQIASMTRTTPEEARVRSFRARKSLKAHMVGCLL
jgi:RNA polymerase sigma-70 factor (ECF subfamily)